MSDDENIVCYVCNGPEINPDRVLECVQCCKSAHFTCLKIKGNAVFKARKKSFFCTPACAEIHSRNTTKPEGYGNVMEEIRSLATVIREVKQDTAKTTSALTLAGVEMQKLVTTTGQIEQSQIFLSAKFEELRTQLEQFNEELGQMRDDNTKVRNAVGAVSERQQYLEDKVERLEIELDKVHRESLSRNAVVVGVPYVENEDVKGLVLKLATAVNLTLQADDVVAARRLKVKTGPGLAGPIIASFRTSQIKESIFDCKRSYGTLLASSICSTFNNTAKITIRDEMTRFGKDLLEEARQLQAEFGFKYVWLGRNGKVLLRRQDGAKVEEISCKQQLYALTRSQKRCLNSSSSSIMSQSSPVMEQQPKRR